MHILGRIDRKWNCVVVGKTTQEWDHHPPIRVKMRSYALHTAAYVALAFSLSSSKVYKSFIQNSRPRNSPERGRASSRNLRSIWEPHHKEWYAWEKKLVIIKCLSYKTELRAVNGLPTWYRRKGSWRKLRKTDAVRSVIASSWVGPRQKSVPTLLSFYMHICVYKCVCICIYVCVCVCVCVCECIGI